MTARAITFRAVAWMVSVLLLALTFIAMPMKYLADEDGVIKVVAPIHGLAYMVYLGVCAWIALGAGWNLRRTALVAIAGTIPIYSFIAERGVSRDLAAQPRPANQGA